MFKGVYVSYLAISSRLDPDSENIGTPETVGKLSEKCWETLDVKVGGGSVEKHYFVSCQKKP